MMMKSVFWWRKPEHPEETTDLRQVSALRTISQILQMSRVCLLAKNSFIEVKTTCGNMDLILLVSLHWHMAWNMYIHTYIHACMHTCAIYIMLMYVNMFER